jgi:hypothetical protein
MRHGGAGKRANDKVVSVAAAPWQANSGRDGRHQPFCPSQSQQRAGGTEGAHGARGALNQTRLLLLLFSKFVISFWHSLIQIKDAALRLEYCL